MKLALYAHFSAKNEVAAYVFHCLKELHSLGFNVCFISNSLIPKASIAPLEQYCERIIERNNEGFDFSMWKEGLAEYQSAAIDELLLINSSIIGPLRPLALLWEHPVVNDCDFWGLTNNDEFGEHLQSYFLVFRRRVLQSEAFRKFWDAVLPYRDKQQVIQSYEIGLTRWLEENGFTWGAIFNQDAIRGLFMGRRSYIRKVLDRYHGRDPARERRNTADLLPDVLIECGMPFIKARLMHGPEAATHLKLLESSSLPPAIVAGIKLTVLGDASSE